MKSHWLELISRWVYVLKEPGWEKFKRSSKQVLVKAFLKLLSGGLYSGSMTNNGLEFKEPSTWTDWTHTNILTLSVDFIVWDNSFTFQTSFPLYLLSICSDKKFWPNCTFYNMHFYAYCNMNTELPWITMNTAWFDDKLG